MPKIIDGRSSLTNSDAFQLELRFEPVPETRHGFPVVVLLHADKDPHGELELSADLFELEFHLLLFLWLPV